MTELEKARNEFIVNYDSVTDKDGRLCLWSILFALKDGFEKGAEWQAKPEHMKHTEEVRGLITCLNETIAQIEDDSPHILGWYDFPKLIEALKPFEKEGE